MASSSSMARSACAAAAAAPPPYGCPCACTPFAKASVQVAAGSAAPRPPPAAWHGLHALLLLPLRGLAAALAPARPFRKVLVRVRQALLLRDLASAATASPHAALQQPHLQFMRLALPSVCGSRIFVARVLLVCVGLPKGVFGSRSSTQRRLCYPFSTYFDIHTLLLVSSLRQRKRLGFLPLRKKTANVLAGAGTCAAPSRHPSARGCAALSGACRLHPRPRPRRSRPPAARLALRCTGRPRCACCHRWPASHTRSAISPEPCHTLVRCINCSTISKAAPTETTS